jgi:hypothetical protein
MGLSRNLSARQVVGPPGEGAVDQIRVRVLPDGRMTRNDAARYLGHTSKTLAMWQMEGKGPPSVLVGGRRFYFKRDLDAFVSGARRRPKP